MSDRIDLPTLDRRLSRGYGAVERTLKQLNAREGGGARATRGEPEGVPAAPLSAEERAANSALAKRFSAELGGLRDVAGQSTFRELQELSVRVEEQPHRDALLRWVHELLQLRIGWDLVVDEVDARDAPDPLLSGRKRRAPEGDVALPSTFDEAFLSLVEAPQVGTANVAFQRLADLASPVAAARKELHARRFEIAHRLGLAHPWALASSSPATALAELARGVLDATEPLAVELHKSLRRTSAISSSASSVFVPHVIHEAFARDAREGWPARLNARWLEDVFRALVQRSPGNVELPTAVGGASFLRGAAAWGSALRQSGTARSLPFTLARDPYPTEARTVGGALAIAVADRVFAKRKLGLPSRSADAHARSLGRVLFFTLRATAAGLAVAMPQTADADLSEELGSRVFGAPLPTALAAAWSYGALSGASRVDAPARLLGAVHAHAFVRGLVGRFDEDWFDNPRAGSHLASIGVGPIWRGDVPDAASVSALARGFEETLG